MTVDGNEISTVDNLLLGLYFFLDDHVMEHQRSVYTVVQALSETGGMASSLIAGLGVFASLVNYYVYVMHTMHLLYFVRDEKQAEKQSFLSSSLLSSGSHKHGI